MATYGLATGGPTFTGFTGVLGTVPNGQSSQLLASTSGTVLFNAVTQDDDKIGKIFRKQANQAVRQLFISMIGANVGANAIRSYKRVRGQAANEALDPTKPSGANLGGNVGIETIFYINRANTVRDDNNLSALMNRISGPAVYPNDLSGATGGGKAGVAAGNIRATGYF